jgi:hypothetical protein
MTSAAPAYGGAVNICDSPTEKSIFEFRMMGKKYARA